MYEAEDILNAATSKKIPRSQLHILDDFWMDQFCNPDRKVERQLRISDYLSIDENSRKKILNTILKGHPTLHTVVHDVFSTESSEALERIKNDFPEVRISRQLKKIASSMSFFSDVFKELRSTTATAEEESKLTLLELNGIEELVISDSNSTIRTPVNLLNKLFAAVPHLKTVVLDTIGIDFKNVNFQNLGGLEIIGLSSAHLSAEKLNDLIACAPRIKVIDLSFCEINFKDVVIPPFLTDIKSRGLSHQS